MKTSIAITAAALCGLGGGLVPTASAQSNPSSFGTVYNIGDSAQWSGSMFDVPGAVASASIGFSPSLSLNHELVGFVTPTMLAGDVLGSNSQLNVFGGSFPFGFPGAVERNFSAGTSNGSESNIEVNFFLGSFINSGFKANRGSTVNIFGGDIRENFIANGGTVHLHDGVVGDNFTADAGVVNFYGGTVGQNLQARGSSTVNMRGSSIRNGVTVHSGSTVNISAGWIDGALSVNGGTVNISGGFLNSGAEIFGGTVNLTGGEFLGAELKAWSGSTINITAGTSGPRIRAEYGSTVNITGGSITSGFGALDGSTVNLFGSAFFLNGVRLTNLSFTEAFTITDRNVELSGTLADGSPFALMLNSSRSGFSEPIFQTGATVTLTLVPAPGSAVLLAAASMFAARRRR
jgi:hypothetical protein